MERFAVHPVQEALIPQGTHMLMALCWRPGRLPKSLAAATSLQTSSQKAHGALLKRADHRCRLTAVVDRPTDLQTKPHKAFWLSLELSKAAK